MDIALCRIPHHSLVVLSCRLVCLDVDAEGAVEFELQSTLLRISICTNNCVNEGGIVTTKTYTVASSPGLSTAPPSTPSSSSSLATFPNRPNSACSLSPSISRSLACFAILNFSVSRRRMSDAWSTALCWLMVWLWFALSVWWVRESWDKDDWREERCWERKVLRVERESEMRRREAVSLPILKCEVHWEMSWVGGVSCERIGVVLWVLGGMRLCLGRWGETYSGGIFVEEHFDDLPCVA